MGGKVLQVAAGHEVISCPGNDHDGKVLASRQIMRRGG